MEETAYGNRGDTFRDGSAVYPKLVVKVRWDGVEETREGFLEKFFNKPPDEYDLDLSAILCDSAGRAVDVVYYASASYGNGIIEHLGDNRYGHTDGEAWGGEEMSLDLGRIPPGVQMIDLIINMHNAVTHEQHFPQLKNAYAQLISVYKGSSKELLRRNLSEKKYIRKNSMVFCRLLREGESWKYEERFETFDDVDGGDLQAIVDKYQ